MARPRKKIDKENFEKLCGMMCTLEEIAGFFNCCDDTINNWCKREYGEGFSGVYKKKSSMGRISLRRNQFELSKKSAAMAIFLGKNYLGQRDSFDIAELDETTKAKLEAVSEVLGGVESVIGETE